MARPWRHPKTGNFYFRKAIPERYREAAGMREFKRSLETADAREARKRHSAIAAEYDALIERLEAPPTPTAEAEQVQTITLTPGDLHALAGDLWRWLLEHYAATPAPPEAFSKAAPNGPWGSTAEPWSGQRYQLQQALRARVPAADQGIVAKFVGDFLAERRIGLGAGDRRAFCEAAGDAIDGALGDFQRRFRGDLTDSPMLARYPQGRPNAPHARPSVKITGLIDAWTKGRENVRQKTREEWQRRLSQFSEFLGHDDALAVTGKDPRRWRDHLRTKDYKAKTINESCIAPVKAIFAAAEAEDVLKTNPFTGMKIALKEDKTKEKPRRPYSEKEAEKLLNAARKRKDAAMRWLPWLMAFTGARINELAQLRKEDVLGEQDISFLRFTTSDAKGHEIKTGASRRDVPIHPALVKEGFLKFVAARDPGWLFTDLPPGRYGRRGDAATKRYGRWARREVGITDKRAVAHSWRHRMADLLRGVGCPDEVLDGILGHALDGQRGTYGEGPPLQIKARWLRRAL